jgi:mannose-6-phosphate isomerase-like protein (cupin superfamily)
MRRFNGRRFTAAAAWDGPTIATIPRAAVKLRWADQPFRWHVNDGEEVFVVIDGTVDMHVRDARGDCIVTLNAGEMLHLAAGEEHVAHPRGVARVLVVEQEP